MQHENSNPSNGGKDNRNKRKPLPALTPEELNFLRLKRFIDEQEVQRFFSISESTMYNWIRNGYLLPSFAGSKKMFDLDLIYLKLEKGTGKKRKGNV